MTGEFAPNVKLLPTNKMVRPIAGLPENTMDIAKAPANARVQSCIGEGMVGPRSQQLRNALAALPTQESLLFR